MSQVPEWGLTITIVIFTLLQKAVIGSKAKQPPFKKSVSPDNSDFQIHFIEDGYILQIVGHRNRLFVNNAG